MSGANGHNRVEAFKLKAQQVFTGPSGMEYRTIQPKPMHLIQAGFPRICFLPALTAEAEAKAEQRTKNLIEQGKYLDELVKDQAKAFAFAKALIHICVIDPKFSDLPPQDCPEGLLAWDYVEEDIFPLFNHLLGRAGYVEVKEAAAAAEAFRGHGDGEAREPGRAVLPDATEPSPPTAAH